MKILSIETSCDETAAAVVEAKPEDKQVKLLSNVVTSSLELHAETGGIIPEVAARAQVEFIIPVIKKALSDANLDIKRPAIDAIAVTYGPGLIGSLLVGVETAKTLSFILDKPLIPVNHLYGHIYANFLTTNDKQPSAIEFPTLALVVSGAHTDLVVLKNHKDLQFLGGTLDDASGECFDKCARLLGYSYPGGPKISQLAEFGNPKAFNFPRPMLGSNDYNFSFSGLKTSFLNTTRTLFPVLRNDVPNSKAGWQQILLDKVSEKEKQTIYDLCASLEQAIIDVLVKKTVKAAKKFGVKSILLGGGVSANEKLKTQLMQNTKYEIPNTEVFYPEKSLSTDNAAMIGAVAFFNQDKASWKELTANPELYFD